MIELQRYTITEKETGREIISIVENPRDVEQLMEHLDDEVVVEEVDDCIHTWQGVGFTETKSDDESDRVIEQCSRCKEYRKRKVEIRNVGEGDGQL